MSALLNKLTPSILFPYPEFEEDFYYIENKAFAFKNDVWDISIFIENKQCYSITTIRFDDVPIEARDLFKKHCYYELGRIKPQSVYSKLSRGKSKLLKFMKEFELNSFENFDTERFLQYIAWLRDTYITKAQLEYQSLINQNKIKEAKKSKPLDESELYKTSLFLKQLLDNSFDNKWHGAPKKAVLLEPSLSFIWNQTSNNLRQKKQENAEQRIIPNTIWEKIINALQEESKYLKGKYNKEFIYRKGQAKGIKAVNFTKYIILIQAFTGLRISEVCALKTGCVFKDRKDRKWLRRTTTKTVLEAQEGDIRIPTKIYEAIKEVDNLSKDYRSKSGYDNLFFAVSTKDGNLISAIRSNIWNYQYLDPFLQRNNICNNAGEIYKVTSHDFRHTFASKLVNEWNVPLSVLTRHYGHLSMEMTMHYVHLSKEKLFKKAIEGFTEASKIIANGEVGENFIKVINEAKVEDDFNGLIEKLTRSFGVNSLPFGVCLYDFRRGHCPNLGVQSCWEMGCSNFATSDKFLPNFEHEMDILEKQVSRDNSLGKVADAKIKKIRYNKLVKIIDDLQNNPSCKEVANG